MPHQQLLKTWAEKSGEVFDYLIDMYEAQGGKVEIRPVEVKEHFYRYVPTQHFFIADAKEGYTGDAQQRLVNTLEAHAKKFGAQSFYNTPAQRLIRNAKGRVTGVIGKDKDGNYIKFNASKGVILATGDFGGNQEMVDAWCPKANLADRKLYTPAGANTGDGCRQRP
jgi:fumarate reductase flavoprotein subunit